MITTEPKYTLPDEFTQAISLAVKKGLELSKALEQCRGKVEDIDNARVQILIESITLALASGDLLRMHYAFPAEVLLRTIVDRVSTVQHIALNGEEGLRDWKSNKLPSLAKRIGSLHDFSEDEIRDIVRPHVQSLHKSTHGDAARASVNMGLESDVAKYWLGPNPTRPEQCDSVAMLLLTQLEIIDHFISQLTMKLANQ